MAEERGASPDGAARADAPSAAGGYPRAARTEETAARLRQSLAEILAVAQDYAARRARETRTAVRAALRDILTGVVLLTTAAAVGGLALCLGLAACVLLLSTAIAAWAAAFIVCGVLLAIAAILVPMGLRRVRTRRLAALIRTLREDMERVRDAVAAPQPDRARPRAESRR